MNARPSKRSVVSALLLLGLSSFLVSIWHHYGLFSRTTTHESDAQAVTKGAPRLDDAGASGKRTVPLAPTSSTPPLQPELEVAAPASKGVDDPHDKHRLTVFVQDERGNRLAGVSLQLTLLKPGSIAGLDTIRSQVDADTDSEGVCKIEVPVGDAVRILTTSPDWFLEPIVRRPTSDSVQRLVLAGAKSVRLTAMYDDGVAFTAHGDLCGARGDNYSVSFAFGSDGAVTVPRVRTSMPLQCILYAGGRAGYSTIREQIEPWRLSSGETIHLVIPRSARPEARIRVLFDQPLPGGCVLTMERRGFTSTTTQLRAGSEVWRSDAIRPGIESRVTVLGALSWRSPWLNVEAGVEHELRAVLMTSGSVRARIVNLLGKPIAGAALRPTDGSYLTYGGKATAAVPRIHAGNASNENGEVVLNGLPAGDIQIEAEAAGMEPVFLAAAVKPGETLDLGEIQLAAATGRIEVRLQGFDEKKTYSVALCQPAVTPVWPIQRIERGIQVFEQVSLRKYVVAVVAGSGGPTRTQTVELTSESPHLVVEIDVSGLDSAPIGRRLGD